MADAIEIPQVGRLRIADLEFAIETATISEQRISASQARWDLEIQACRLEMPVADWQPCIRGEHILVNAPPLHAIAGRVIPVNGGLDEEPLLFCVFEHNVTREDVFHFMEFKDHTIRVECTGRCDVHYDQKYGSNLPYALNVIMTIEKNRQH